MRRLLVTLILAAILAGAAGCADLGISNPFGSSPAVRQSRLLGISLPAGMELSVQHSAQTTGSDGQPQGMETLYGQADRQQVAQSLYSSLQGLGWNVRMSLRKGEHTMLVFENGNRLAVIAISSQTVYSCVAEIWVAEKQPDGSPLSILPLGGGQGGGHDGTAASGASGGGFEDNGPATGGGFETPDSGSTPPPVGTSESWGASSGSGGLQERAL